MKIVNACERFSWRATYWVNDGYGKLEKKSKTAPSLSFYNKVNKKTNAVKAVDCIINKMMAQGMIDNENIKSTKD